MTKNTSVKFNCSTEHEAHILALTPSRCIKQVESRRTSSVTIPHSLTPPITIVHLPEDKEGPSELEIRGFDKKLGIEVAYHGRVDQFLPLSVWLDSEELNQLSQPLVHSIGK